VPDLTETAAAEQRGAIYALRELADRLTDASNSLEQLAQTNDDISVVAARLRAKREGVLLAKSYVHEQMRLGWGEAR
jgi:hypothetical protein